MIKQLLTIEEFDDLAELIEERDGTCRLIPEDIQDPNMKVLGYYLDHELVAILSVTCMKVFPNWQATNGKYAHISGVYTKKNYRRRGYAKALFNTAQYIANQYGADYICCDTSEVDFFKSLGFGTYSIESRMWYKCS